MMYLNVEQLVARYNGTISKSTLANWRSNREGPPYVKVGGRVMYRLSDVEEWEKRRTSLKCPEPNA